MPKQGFIAFDLGAESGRAMLGVLDGERFDLKELHRFPNLPQALPSGYHWNLTELYRNLVEGLRAAAKMSGDDNITLASCGVDTWGVDCGFVGASGQLLGLPFAYRDDRNPPAMRKAFDALGEKAIYDATGIQFLPFNTLFQLIAQQDAEPAVLTNAKRMLNMPDLLHYFLSGEQVNEATIASTTQMIDPRHRNGQWNKALLEQLGLPTGLLGEIKPAGTVIGKLRQTVADEAGVSRLAVIVPGSHDTASAVAAVPVDTSQYGVGAWAYLSSGTWSLMGAELDEPIVSDASREAGFTNERGVDDKIRFLKNIAGLWLVQEVRREYTRRGEQYDYDQLTKLASEAEPFRTLVDCGHEPFASPGDMPQKIAAFAESTGQPKPETVGQFVRCCLESLALTYRLTLEGLEQLLGTQVKMLHVVGGGGKNKLLNQMTADALGRPVIVGPYEATAIGNALTQAMGHGAVRDLAHVRQIVRGTYDPVTYEPTDRDAYAAELERFRALQG